MRQAAKRPPSVTPQPERDAPEVLGLLLRAINQDAATLAAAAEERGLTGYEREALVGYYREVARSVQADREFTLKYSDPTKMDEDKLREELRETLQALPASERQLLLSEFIGATQGAQA